jgi:hypothetical protein
MAQDYSTLEAVVAQGTPAAGPRRWREPAALIALFLFAFMVYTRGGGVVPMTDTVWTVPIALSLIHEGNLDLNEFTYAHGDGRLRHVNDRWVSFFPVGAPVVIAPALAIVEGLLRGIESLDLYEHLRNAPDWELVASLNRGIASFFAALTVVLIYLTSRLSLSMPKAALLAVVVAFGTSLWSTASQDLWQHTISTLMVAGVIYLLVRAQQRPAWMLFWCGLATAAAYTVRPTNSLLVLLVTIYVLIEHRRWVIYFLAGSVLVAVPFVLYNFNHFGNLLAPYYSPDRLANSPYFWEALAGNLVSPSRGLLIFSPLLLFVLYGVALKIRNRQFRRLDAFLAAALVLHWLAISSFRHWWGGASYGPRFFTDLLPVFAYFLIPVVAQVTEPAFWTRWRGRAVGALFAASVVWSIFVHYRGSTQAATWHWNGTFPKVLLSVDEAPARLWDWSDPQFWRGLRPAAPVVEPAALCVTGRAGDATAVTQALRLVNRGDEPYTWTMKTPQRVFQQAAYDRVPGLGYGEPQLIIDTARLGVGDHALGSLVLTARAVNGEPVKDDPLIVPVTVRILPANLAPTDQDWAAAGDCTTFNTGIRIDGQERSFDQSQLFAIFGPEWYDVETAGAASWRWVASPARIFIFAPQHQEVTLTSTPIALHDQQASSGFGDQGVMRVSAANRSIAELPVQTGQPFEVLLNIQPGWNEISLELLAGNMRPVDLDPASGDARLLSFAVGPVEIQNGR